MSWKKGQVWALVAALAVVVLGACGQPEVPLTPTAATVPIDLYFGHQDLTLGPDYVAPVERYISADEDRPRTAIALLLEGPTLEEQAEGFFSAIPDPEEVIAYRERLVEAGYDPPYEGDRVRLLSLEIADDGTAIANFSKEMVAYGGGSMRVNVITQQIERTLSQFESIERVKIAVAGETEGVLQP